MKATHVAICPTPAAKAAGRPALTPELLAATGARYSRSNDGLEAILAKIDPENPDKSVDSIFRMVDYGHASIADMAPVAIFIDGLSMWLAYYVWSLCPTAGGQESSTRYIRLSVDNLPDAAQIGIPEPLRAAWQDGMARALEAYETAVAFWEGIATEHPEVTRIPKALLEDPSDKAQKAVGRMKRNYAFDRARYFLPAALRTNMMLVQSARAWVTLCQQLLSHPLPEAQQLGNLLRDELALTAPRLLKHAEAKPSFQQGLTAIREGLYRDAVDSTETEEPDFSLAAEPKAFLDVFPPRFPGDMKRALQFHDNRYAYMGEEVQRTGVRFGWEAVTLGDMRDLNRHRTGTKYQWWFPAGFYGAAEQWPEAAALQPLCALGGELSRQAYEGLFGHDWSFVYWFLLGTQFQFEHTTTADKFIYEAELRTGVGAHYRYAQHLHDALALWYEKYPETRGLILEGSAEPE